MTEAAPTIYIEAYACSDHGEGPTYAIIDASDALIRRMQQLQELCKTAELSEARVVLGCDWGPDGIEDDLRLQNHELVVAGDSFWFRADPKHADYHVETRLQDIDAFVNAVRAREGDAPLTFGDYSDDEWENVLAGRAADEVDDDEDEDEDTPGMMSP